MNRRQGPRGDEHAVGLVPEEGVEVHDRDEVVLARGQDPVDERDVVHFPSQRLKDL